MHSLSLLLYASIKIILWGIKKMLSVLFFLRDFMDPTMDNTKHILNYLMPIIERVNPEVHDFMQQ